MNAWTRWLFRTVSLTGVLLLAGCGDKKKASKEDLADAGYQLTKEDWFRAAAGDDPSVLAKFVSGGIAVDTRDAAGDTALHAAAAAGAEKSANFLLNRKLPVDVRGAHERTPLMSAVTAGRTPMVRWLLQQGADAKAKDADGYKPLMLAVREGKDHVVSELAAYDREDLDNALLVAALLGRAPVIDELTNYGASVYARMDDGRTALMVAAENGHVEAVKLLVDIGANRFTTDTEGRTAADFAHEEGHEEVVAILNAEPKAADLSLQSEDKIGSEMAAAVDHAVDREDTVVVEGEGSAAAPDTDSGAGSGGGTRTPRTHGTSSSGGSPAARSEVASIQGQTIGSTATQGAGKPVPLVMRSYRERELPLSVQHVEGTTARIRIRGPVPKDVKVAEGETIPGSRLKIVRIQRRMQSGKENFGKPMEVSVVEVEDTATGARRNLIAGVPSSAHDPVALVEDAATGKRYVAAPGRQFTGADGTRYTVADVRPGQLVIEESGTGAVQTLSLRGPRG